MTHIEETTKVSATENGNGSPLHENSQMNDPYINNEARRVLEIIFYVALTGSIAVLGSAANAINIIIFFKQGFSESVNISFCGLAVSDLFSLLALLWKAICINPLFQYSNIDFDSVQIQYATAGLPRSAVVRITSWITSFIAFERCVCVVLPIKVKDIITPRRTLITIVTIFILTFVSVSPVFFSVKFSSKFHPQRNRTMIGLAYASNFQQLQDISFSIHVFSQFSTLIFVIVCTVTLIHNLTNKSRWRVKAMINIPGKTDLISLRDKRVMKMVTLISIIFIFSLLPNCGVLIFMISFPSEFSVIGRYQNTFQVSWAIVNTLEAVNSSINIIVYYKMSSKFRASFNQHFWYDKCSY